MAYTSYQKKNPGDVLKLQDWLEIQQRIKEELREHQHLGVDRDGEVAASSIGPKLDSRAFEPGAVTSGKIASGSVGELAMAPSAVYGYHINPDIRLSESLFRFREQGGHNHDGIVSRALAPGAVDTRQMQDSIITEAHLEGAPADNDLSADEETYARGRAFTPGNVLRAARQLIDHTELKNRPLLRAGGYVAIEGTSLIVRGFLLDRLIATDGSNRDYLSLEFHPDSGSVTRTPVTVLDETRIRADVPTLGSNILAGFMRVTTGNGTEDLPWTPISNAVRFTYEPAAT